MMALCGCGTSKPRTVPVAGQVLDLAWSPNGEMMAFAPERLNENQWTLSDVRVIPPNRDQANVASQSQMMSLTHRRLGHPGQDRFNHAIEVYSIKNVRPILETYPCKPCDLNKSHREPLSKEP
jgi:hypothetical protein